MRIKRKVALVTASAFALVALLAAPAQAQSQSLAITAVTVSDFSTVALTGSAITTTATMSDFSITDSRALAEGWNVVVQGTQFAEHNGTVYVAGGKTLPAGSLSMTAPTVSSTQSPLPTVTSGPYSIDGHAVKIASAALGTGLGTYTFTQNGPLTLTVVAGAYARAYRSDITVSVASGP